MEQLHPSSLGGFTAYIALGSNMGEREELLRQAVAHLNGRQDIEVLRISSLYETDPVGYTDQPAFLNMVIAVQTTLDPVGLLRVQLEAEQLLGRVRDIRWGPRTIDLDLLLYDNVTMDETELTLPHPRMMERAFVLVPLSDVIAGEHPMRAPVATAAAAALQEGKEGIALWKTINWLSGSAHFGS